MFPLGRTRPRATYDGRKGRDVLLAHQGGWDELLMVLVPIAAVVLLLRVANRRSKAAGEPPAER